MITKKGFTLMELLVIVLIIGILAAIATPQFTKTREQSKMQAALPIARTIALANKMYRLDHGVYGSLQQLLDGKYVAELNTQTVGYEFVACVGTLDTKCQGVGSTDPSMANYPVAYAQRIGTTSAPYNGWWFTVNQRGECTSKGTNQPDCSKW